MWVAMTFGASQPSLALGRQTSNCHVGQDYAEGLLPAPFGRLLRGRRGACQHLPESCSLSAGQILDQVSQLDFVALAVGLVGL